MLMCFWHALLQSCLESVLQGFFEPHGQEQCIRLFLCVSPAPSKKLECITIIALQINQDPVYCIPLGSLKQSAV